MNSEPDIWFSLLQTFGMLFVVLAFFLVLFYLFRKMTGSTGFGRGGQDLIRVVSVHHLSPKERLVLVSIQNRTWLLGVTPNGISTLSEVNLDPEMIQNTSRIPGGFAQMLGRKMGPGGKA